MFSIQERTPGVGMEVVHTVNDVTFTDELKQSIEALEMKIAECCENENFEEAGEYIVCCTTQIMYSAAALHCFVVSGISCLTCCTVI